MRKATIMETLEWVDTGYIPEGGEFREYTICTGAIGTELWVPID